mgnify:CR=1 FL=1
MQKTKIKFLIFINLILFIFSSCLIEEENEESYYQVGEVERIVDGDTAHIIIDGEKQKVRFTGINTPEYNPKKGISDHYGKEAFNYTKDQIKNKKVYLEKDMSDADKYGRLLRYIWIEEPKDPSNPTKEELGEINLNGKLVKEGYAFAGNYKPDVKYKDIFDEFENEAKENNRGMWKWHLIKTFGQKSRIIIYHTRGGDTFLCCENNFN